MKVKDSEGVAEAGRGCAHGEEYTQTHTLAQT